MEKENSSTISDAASFLLGFRLTPSLMEKKELA
jgi:hypothetical protein